MDRSIGAVFRKSLVMGCAYRLFRAGSSLCCAWLISQLFQRAVAADFGAVARLAGLLCAAVAIGSFGCLGLTKKNERVCAVERQDFRALQQQRILSFRLPAASSGEMETRLNEDGGAIADHYQKILPDAVEGVTMIVGSVLLMCRTDPWISVILLGCSLLQMVPTIVYQRWAKRIYESITDHEEEEWDWLAQGVEGLRTLKLYNREQWYIGRYREIGRMCVTTGGQAEFTGGIENIIFEGIHAFLSYGAYFLLGVFLFRGALTAGQAPGMIVLSGYLFSNVNALFNLSIQSAVFRTAKEHLTCRTAPAAGEAKGALLEVCDVSKAFKEKTVLSRLSFAIEPGQRIRVQGPNGSGKSTLLRLITGVLSPDSGEIRRQAEIAWSMQEEPELLLTGDALLAAVRSTGCLDEDTFRRHCRGFRIPEALFAKPVGSWSMGERKKLFLALALAKKAELLILDEPTNHIDTDARSYLKDQLAQYPGAMLVCTHDPYLDIPWDRVVDLKGGERI